MPVTHVGHTSFYPFTAMTRTERNKLPNLEACHCVKNYTHERWLQIDYNNVSQANISSLFLENQRDHHVESRHLPYHQVAPEDMLAEESEQQEAQEPADPAADSQNFFPSFSPFGNQPLGHSRPFFFQQEGAYSQRPTTYQNLGFEIPKFKGYKPPQDTFKSRAASETKETHGLLGSGNFGVISGGTFYNDNDKEAAGSSNYDSDDFSSFYSNGHGRPSFYFGGATNPKPQKHQEQFANFRDFADINTPSSPAFSQYIVVYVNKDGTKQIMVKPEVKPKNIIERLALLDLEAPSSTTTTEPPPTKKLSKSKRKLTQLPPEKKAFVKKAPKEKSELTKDFNEPLLALS